MAADLISFARGAPSADILPAEAVREAAQRALADGIDVEELERVVRQMPVKLVHVIPNFHNPAGCTLSADKRARLVELAAEHGFWIFEDDPYRELPFEHEPPATMLSGSDRVIHSSSFSKTVSPGVRVGYLAGPPDEIAALG